MTRKEKMNLLEETFELEANSLEENTVLAEIETYDSMAKLSLIVLCDDEFGKKLSGEQIRAFITVKDVLDFLE